MKSSKIHVLLTDAEKKALREAAEALAISQSAYGRAAIRLALKNGGLIITPVHIPDTMT